MKAVGIEGGDSGVSLLSDIEIEIEIFFHRRSSQNPRTLKHVHTVQLP